MIFKISFTLAPDLHAKIQLKITIRMFILTNPCFEHLQQRKEKHKFLCEADVPSSLIKFTDAKKYLRHAFHILFFNKLCFLTEEHCRSILSMDLNTICSVIQSPALHCYI